MRDQLAHNQFPKWYSVTYKQAQSRANDGAPGIGITPDHIVIVRPNDGTVPSDVKYVRIAQAGGTCYNDKLSHTPGLPQTAALFVLLLV